MKEVYSEKELSKLGYKQFMRLLGVNRTIFYTMITVLKAAYAKKHLNGGRPSKLSVHEMTILFLLYIKDYKAMESLAFEFKIAKSVVCDTIHWILETLLKNKNFTLFGSKCTKNDGSENRLLDVTEIRIERPKYNQKQKYSGKKKYHTMKIQIIRGAETGFIYEIQIGLGREHDFHLFKRTFEGSPENVTYSVDLGYVGIQKVHNNSELPKKNTKKHPLTEEDKEYNKEIARRRIFIEHTNSWIKRFNILSTKFRNNLNYFASFSVLLCAFYNLDRA